jgi:hypothetical protein
MGWPPRASIKRTCQRLVVRYLEFLRQEFTMDDAECEILVSSALDAAQDLISSYDFASLAESDDNYSPKAL